MEFLMTEAGNMQFFYKKGCFFAGKRLYSIIKL